MLVHLQNDLKTCLESDIPVLKNPHFAVWKADGECCKHGSSGYSSSFPVHSQALDDGPDDAGPLAGAMGPPFFL